MKILEIIKEDLIHNINIIKKLAKNEDGTLTTIIAVVKGNAYGLGIVEFVEILVEQGIDFFAVSNMEEALSLRAAGKTQNILMLSSTAIKEDIKKLVENDIILTLGSVDAAKIAE